MRQDANKPGHAGPFVSKTGLGTRIRRQRPGRQLPGHRVCMGGQPVRMEEQSWKQCGRFGRLRQGVGSTVETRPVRRQARRQLLSDDARPGTWLPRSPGSRLVRVPVAPRRSPGLTWETWCRREARDWEGTAEDDRVLSHVAHHNEVVEPLALSRGPGVAR